MLTQEQKDRRMVKVCQEQFLLNWCKAEGDEFLNKIVSVMRSGNMTIWARIQTAVDGMAPLKISSEVVQSHVHDTWIIFEFF